MIVELLEAGWLAVVDYVALHVLTSLVPAFLLAGAMVSFISKETIMYYLGAAQSKLKAFPLAAGGSFFVAACSCTVIPVGSGLYYGGASIGAAFILLWVAPSSNILSLIYTGNLLGWQIVVARLVSALVLAAIVGWVMTWLFRAEEKTRIEERAAQVKATPGQTVGKVISRPDFILLGLILVSLLAPNYVIQEGPFWQKVVVWAVATVIAGGYAWKAYEVRLKPGVFPDAQAALESRIRARRAEGKSVSAADIEEVEAMANDLNKKLLNTPPGEVLQITGKWQYRFRFNDLYESRSDIINKDAPR